MSMYVKYLDKNSSIKYFKLESGTMFQMNFFPYTWFYKNLVRVIGGFKKILNNEIYKEILTNTGPKPLFKIVFIAKKNTWSKL